MKKVGFVLAVVAALAENLLATSTPIIVSANVRTSDPTILDVVYRVSSERSTVRVRALAFEDGLRSFAKIVRPTTFVNDLNGNPTEANVGDSISANVDHSLSWKVSSDWNTDLAQCTFDILVSEDGQLPFDVIDIPAIKETPVITVSYSGQTDNNVLKALFWYYANGEDDLINSSGKLYWRHAEAVTWRDLLVDADKIDNKLMATQYVFEKMGCGVLSGEMLRYAKYATRKELASNSNTQHMFVKPASGSRIFVADKAFCIIDISEGVAVSTYPVSYSDYYPADGWGDEYKTTKLLLRKIDPGIFKFRGTTEMSITNSYYIGVFEITQKQYELVMGANPSEYVGDMRPVENLPRLVVTDGDETFIARISAKSGLSCQLPSETEWEYACKAGTTTYYNNGGNAELDLRMIGRSYRSRNDGRGGYTGHTTVGSYFPNEWGLYDMLGNVAEMCRDTASACGGEFCCNDLRVDKDEYTRLTSFAFNRDGVSRIGFRLSIAISK